MKSTHLSSRLTGALAGLALWAMAPAVEAASKPLVPRAAAVKQSGRELPADTRVERLVVKFHEGSRVRLRGNRLAVLATERGPAERALLSARGLSESRLAEDVRAASGLLERAPRAGALARLFQEDEAVLESRKAAGEEQRGQQLADLNLYFEVPLLPGTTSEGVADLVAALNALDGVEVAYAQPPAEPAMVNFGMDAAVRSLLAAADIAPTTPLYEGNQGYLNGAPGGIDARYAWGIPGGNGAGVRVVDIEGGWRTTHEDMPNLFYQGGTQFNDLGWRNHGTAVLGEIVGAPNAYGVTGIAHAASAGVESIGSQSTASAISRAAAAVGRGGVILIELHAQGPADSTACTCNQGQCNYIAMEYWQGEYDAIATATANGVVVVEAAGNGSANLDDAAYGGRFNRSVRDSGAIVVGASTSTTRVPMCWTNFGGRVDVHGWGENVTTLGYGDLFNSGEDQYYTSYFSGTSSASPIVTGAAASIQGVARAAGRALLDSRTMRGLLAGTGTAQASDSRRIGPLPDLRRALTQLRSSCSLLAPGQSLTPGQSVNSCMGDAVLVHQGDGNVVLYQGGRARWASGTGGRTGLLVMQGDGNLVLYSPEMAPLWASGTSGYPGARLDLEQGCTLVIRGTDGRALWSSGSRCVTQACGSLLTGDLLYPGQAVSSCNGRATFILQGDGNVVLYQGSRALWNSATQGVPGMLTMQGDGNLVLYSSTQAPLWASGTSGQSGAQLFVQDDCHAVIYNTAGQPVWYSNTRCQ
jgi:hypothetical protein